MKADSLIRCVDKQSRHHVIAWIPQAVFTQFTAHAGHGPKHTRPQSKNCLQYTFYTKVSISDLVQDLAVIESGTTTDGR
jgi:hypothetical protein